MAADDGIGQAQFSPEGPIQIAQMWFTAVLQEKNLGKAWPLTHPRYRQEIAESWVGEAVHPAGQSKDPAGLAEVLAGPAPDDPIWPLFEEATLAIFAEHWSYLDMESWGWVSAANPHGPGTELVYMADLSHPGLVKKGDGWEVAEGAEFEVTGLLMELLEEDDGVQLLITDNIENRWRVADTSSRVRGRS
jgi:hypothetical protein